jgi:hypothetical protein
MNCRREREEPLTGAFLAVWRLVALKFFVGAPCAPLFDCESAGAHGAPFTCRSATRDKAGP